MWTKKKNVRNKKKKRLEIGEKKCIVLDIERKEKRFEIRKKKKIGDRRKKKKSNGKLDCKCEVSVSCTILPPWSVCKVWRVYIPQRRNK